MLTDQKCPHPVGCAPSSPSGPFLFWLFQTVCSADPDLRPFCKQPTRKLPTNPKARPALANPPVRSRPGAAKPDAPKRPSVYAQAGTISKPFCPTICPCGRHPGQPDLNP